MGNDEITSGEMMKKSFFKKIILFILLGAFVFGSRINSYASIDDDVSAVAKERHPVGGGYAATSQIDGVYFLPKIYDASNGLPTSEANYILAAKNGYIWIGGYSGLVKYDGTIFEKIPATDGLTSVRGLFEDSKGRIWVATNDSGVVVIDGREHIRFTKKDGLSSNSIRTFAEDFRGNIFIGSTAGVAYVDATMTLHNIDSDWINNERILRLVTDAGGSVFGHTGSGNLFSVTTKGVSEYYTSSGLGMKVTTIYPDPEKPRKLYYGTNSNCVYYGRFGAPTNVLDKIDTGRTKNIHWLHYACGRLWVSSSVAAGYVDENMTYVPFDSFPMKDSIEMMTSDYQGNIWFASSRAGVMKLVADNFLDMTGAAEIEPEAVNTTCKRGEDLFIGTDNGLKVIDKDYISRKNKYTEYFDGIRIRCIMNDSRGNTWVSTFSDLTGLVLIDSGGKIKKFTSYEGMTGNEVRCTYEMSDGRIVAGTSNGLAIIKDGKVVDKYTSRDGLKNPVILTVSEDDDGNIMAGTDGDGIYIFENDNIRRIGIEDGLGSDVIMRIKRDEKRGVIWVVTSNQVQYIKDGNIVTVTTFPYNNNFDVITEDDEDLWFLSSQGIYVVDADAVLNDEISIYKLYDRANGLTSIPISHCFSGVDDEGNAYIAGQTGVSAVNIREMMEFSGRTITDVRSIVYDGEEIWPDEEGVYNLPQWSGRIQITPAIIDYTVTDPLVRIYLEGMDDEGITATQSKLTPLEYTGMKYGEYYLHIQILDNRTTDIISDSRFKIVKKPGFFERLSVRIVFMLLALALIGFIVWRIMNGTVIRKQYVQIQEARDEAERANSAKSRFLANMSHEIRTPINTIMGMDEMILREDTKGIPKEYYGPVTSYARNIKYASESLLSLINDLLDISKIESGKMHLVEQEYDTEEMLRGIVSMIRGRAEDKRLYFDLDIDESLPKRLYGDNGKIKQIVLNLLTNAVKYTDDGGFTMSVRVTEKNEAGIAVAISVKDTGIGVKKEDLDKLFSAYERLDEVKNSAIQGTGLGLDISRQFAELMGGKLWCESVYGEGSEFIFTFKQKLVDAAPIGVFLEESADSQPGTYMPQFIAPDADILIVDDNPMNLSVIKGLLKPTKIFVTTAKSGEECLQKISENDFYVVLLDHMMPGMDGIETMARIRETRPDLPVYALTANSTAGGEAFYKSKGFNGYLTKPIDIVAVEHAIMKHLPESIMSKPTEADVVVEENDLTEDMDWIREAKGISYDDGIANSGGAKQYVFSLNMFYDSIDENSAVIEKAYKDDLKLATVKIHALKSSARIIGALSLSEECQKLENAGNEKDMEYIEAHKDLVLAQYREFKEILKRLKSTGEKAEDLPPIPEGELADAYEALSEVIPQMDYDAVEMIVGQLREYKLPGEDDELISAIEKEMKLLNWEKMEELINNK